ncbi:MAG TPA: amino acid ABC transporter permease [Nitriliruptorales bacterium]|nr:amino acid ABC transporter permease [Nitriliruptorales bacterium]
MVDEVRADGARVGPGGTETAPKEPLPAPPEEPAVHTIETAEGIAITVPEAVGPPIREIGVREWVRENLFPSRLNSVLTVLFALLLGWVAFKAFRFVFVTGRWRVVEVNLTTLMVGRFPRSELWRPVATGLALAAFVPLWAGRTARSLAELSVAPASRDWRATWTRVWPFLLLLAATLSLTRTVTPTLLVLAMVAVGVAAYWLGTRVPPRLGRWVDLSALVGVLMAFYLPLFAAGYGWNRWGGLMMNLFAAAVGIGVSFPIGILLALGRRSRLPGIRAICVGYIELIRGVPLVTLLLMAFFVVGFMFPRGFRAPELVARALIILVAFTAAYVAEIVRGGLQSVPRGQIEAAQAVGLAPWKVTRLIVLPQALRNVIPALVGQFISLFKDTSLLFVIGILELLRVAQVILQQPDFRAQDLQAETHVFAAFVFWVFAYAMSKESQRLERRLGLGER